MTHFPHRVARVALLLFIGLTLLPVGLQATAGEQAIEAPVAGARIEVHKSERKLLLFSGDRLLRSYDIGLGFEPVAPKARQGDGATPEGEYFVCVKNPQSQYYLSLGLNYPNARDAERGLQAGLISKAEARRIKSAEKRGVRPPWDTRLGGEIFIHGRGAGADWTLGCVALEDADMKELYDATSIGTKVVIKP